MRARLQLGAAHPVKVWLNSKVVFEGKPGSAPAQPDQSAVDVDLREGVNRLIFRVTYTGEGEALYARLLDPERRLLYNEEPKR